jgi:hypothetical protein
MLAVVSADARRAVDAHERLADSISARLAAVDAETHRDGESTATVIFARLHRDGPGAANGGIRAIYPSRESEATIPVDIPHGIDLGLVFDHAVMRSVTAEPLTVVLEYRDDRGLG